MTNATFDVLGVGHAIVDILATTTDAFLNEHGIAKNSMTLVDGYRAEMLGRSMKNPVEASGGSGANTMVGVASFGGTAAFIGKVNDDRLGQVFMDDIRHAGVSFDCAPAHGKVATASSHILITPDGHRSMNTFLGCASALEDADANPTRVASAKILYVEGYLWDTDSAKSVIRSAIARSKAAVAVEIVGFALAGATRWGANLHIGRGSTDRKTLGRAFSLRVERTSLDLDLNVPNSNPSDPFPDNPSIFVKGVEAMMVSLMYGVSM